MSQRELFREWEDEKEPKTYEVLQQRGLRSFFERVKIHLSIEGLLLCVLVNLSVFAFFYTLGFEQGLQKGEHDGKTPPPEPAAQVQPVAPVVFQEAKTPEFKKPEPGRSLTEILDIQGFEKGIASHFFTIQIVTYKSAQLAREEVSRWKEKGFRSFVIPSGQYYQVCIDLFEKRPDAYQKLATLKETDFGRFYQDAFVRPLRR